MEKQKYQGEKLQSFLKCASDAHALLLTKLNCRYPDTHALHRNAWKLGIYIQKKFHNRGSKLLMYSILSFVLKHKAFLQMLQELANTKALQATTYSCAGL